MENVLAAMGVNSNRGLFNLTIKKTAGRRKESALNKTEFNHYPVDPFTTIVAWSATFRIITAPAPIFTHFPILIPGITTAPAPTCVPSPTLTPLQSVAFGNMNKIFYKAIVVHRCIRIHYYMVANIRGGIILTPGMIKKLKFK